MPQNCPSLSTDTPQLLQILLLLTSTLTMLTILLPYTFCLKNKLNLAFTVLTGLFVNQLLASLSRLLPYIWCYIGLSGASVICPVSVTITTFFQASADLWTCYIARLAYREATQPGRYVSFRSHFKKSIVGIYMPPLLVCLALFALILAMPKPETLTMPSCFYTPQPQPLYYAVSSIAFLFPNLFTTIFNLHYIIRYFRSQFYSFNKFLIFPFIQVLMSTYCLFVAGWKVVLQETPFEYSEVPAMGLPVIYALVYWVLVLGKLHEDRDSDVRSRSIISSKAMDYMEFSA